MRPPVRLLQPLEAPSLQLSKSIYVCSSCRHNVLPACSLNHSQTAARRHASSSGRTPFTDRLRQRIWGTDKPLGLEDPYGGEGAISKAFKKRRGEATSTNDNTGEQEQEQEMVQYTTYTTPEEVEEAAAAAAAAEVGRKKDGQYTGDFTPATTADGLPVIGHRKTWTSVGPKEGDKYRPFLTRSKARTKQHVRTAAHSVAVELCILHDLKRPLEAALEATEHEKLVWNMMRKCRINPDAKSLDGALIYPKEHKKVLRFVFRQLGEQTQEEPLDSAEAKAAAKFHQPASKSHAVKTSVEPKDKGYLSFPLTDPAVRFTYLARLAQITGHYVPDSEMVTMTTVKQVVDYLEQAIAPRKKLADELSALPSRQGIPNLTVKFSRYTKADHDRDIGRRKIIEEALRERGLLYEQDTSSKFRI